MLRNMNVFELLINFDLEHKQLVTFTSYLYKLRLQVMFTSYPSQKQLIEGQGR